MAEAEQAFEMTQEYEELFNSLSNTEKAAIVMIAVKNVIMLWYLMVNVMAFLTDVLIAQKSQCHLR